MSFPLSIKEGDSKSSNKISEHLKSLTPFVENGFWKLGGKVLDHFFNA